jgi:protein-L-isoaspartate O-methyltransferase
MNQSMSQLRKTMEQFTNTAVAIMSKPITGAGIGVSAVVLKWMGIISTGLGLIAAVIGVCAAVYSLIHNRNLVKEDRKRLKDLGID